MELKVIKNSNEYHHILYEAERLVSLDPAIGTADADKLELLTVLIEDFERKQFPFPVPDAVDAILFRMEEQGLRQIDLVPLIGSRSRVSEVLARKRPLTIPMIRALSTGLGIPLETLLLTTNDSPLNSDTILDEEIRYEEFPIKEMQKRGWIAKPTSSSFNIKDLVGSFLAQVSLNPSLNPRYRRNFKGEEIDSKSYYSVLAWTARVLIKSKLTNTETKFDLSKINPDVFRQLAHLSWFAEGPKLAKEFLDKLGIILVIEHRLPNALIDGVAMMREDGTPVIGMSLRHDRIDYFWFTLLHELAHVWKHLNTQDDAYIDRIENMGNKVAAEKEANRGARDACIPRSYWKRSSAFLNPTTENIVALANELHIHPAIVAGRLQFENNRFDLFRDLLGQGSVRSCFPEVTFK